MSTAACCVARTPLEGWVAGRLGVPGSSLTAEAIRRYQLDALRETVAWARRHSSFYRRRLASLPEGLPGTLEDITCLPFTTANDLAENAHGFLCVSQDQISRVVTFNTSGTSGACKRIFFTPHDQELTLEFFANGISTMAAPGDRMLIALPGEREGNVGYQLARGIERAGIIAIPHGLSADPRRTLACMEEEGATCIIGLPVQMLALATSDSALADRVFRRLRSIVLCSDHAPESLVRRLRQRTGAEIFEHYGMTEMGLGGGVDCGAHMGYHLREPDLFVEIVEPETGEPLPDGELGEVVFTTLNRTGTPLIRYRTGDRSRFLPGTCGCGTILKRLERVQGRVEGSVRLTGGGYISMATLDEALFAIPGLLNFTAVLHQISPHRLEVTIHSPGIDTSDFQSTVRGALNRVPVFRQSCATGELRIDFMQTRAPFPVTGAKRKIEVRAGQ